MTAFIRCVLSTYGGIYTVLAPVYAEYANRASSTRLVLALLSMGAIIDVIIAISMVYFLLKTREKAISRHVHTFFPFRTTTEQFYKATKLLDRLIGFSLREYLSVLQEQLPYL